MSVKTLQTRCCIAGGGPAGMMLGFLLARAGIKTIILEKHTDFLRDFRGDTIHPSTLEIMHELGLLEEFLKCPHQRVHKVTGFVEDIPITIADLSGLKVKCPFVAFMPQWDFLNFLASEGKKYPAFTLIMQAEVTGLVEAGNKIAGVKVKTPEGELHIESELVIGADGRSSIVREQAGLQVMDIGAPMDVLWFRLSRKVSDPSEIFGKFSAGKIMVMLNRGDYWQCAYIIAKGGREKIEQAGLPAFKEQVAALVPFMHDRVGELKNWDDIKLLTVKIDRLKKWYRPGLLCIGDAAHAMSPLGGVGINLAIQDAVAAANILIGPLKQDTADQYLQAVQRRRQWPTKVIQALQVVMQNVVIKNVLRKNRPLEVPWFFQQLQRLPLFRRMTGRIIGIGVRPEHIRQ